MLAQRFAPCVQRFPADAKNAQNCLTMQPHGTVVETWTLEFHVKIQIMDLMWISFGRVDFNWFF